MRTSRHWLLNNDLFGLGLVAWLVQSIGLIFWVTSMIIQVLSAHMVWHRLPSHTRWLHMLIHYRLLFFHCITC